MAFSKDELESLATSERWLSRAQAADQGYALDRLVNDPEPWVREAVAEQGYGLDVLMSDSSRYVRAAVALQGYGLDELANDSDLYVREAAAKAIEQLEAERGDANKLEGAKARAAAVNAAREGRGGGREHGDEAR